tara:strand:- start:3224 stop:5968 length:2745 start_codon:yes stop_codon:yes gene_type:complete
MSIKTIDKPMQGSAGIAKKINKGAEKMVFDILQSTQYSMPIQSTIRELVTNACDSQREKEVAVEILSGKKKVEDYYIERHGAQYEDSNFDSSYYQLSSLQHGKNHVDLLYKQNEGLGYCDIFSVTDYGVGIGSRRLEGILELGYSTKRNTSENFGAFGLGAKAALSTGVDFYTIETIYNGMRFKCNCYNYKTDFIIPAFNVKTGMQNQFITFSDGTKVYYEYSNEVNQTTVSFGVKRHNRNKFEEAIEEQLMYFDNVNFKIKDEDEYTRDVNFKTEVIYNSDNIIVGDSYYFSKPHIVLVKDKKASTGINYGYIDFKELEMEQMYGCIAFKCPARQVVTNEDGTETVLQEGVDVTPSREKVIWNESTKNYIKGVIKAAAEEASIMVEKQLEETDFLKWVDKCRSIISGDTDDRILSRISRIVDKNDIKPKFGPDPRIKYSHITKLFEGLKLMKPFRLGNVMERDAVKDWHSFDAKHFYAREEQFSKYKDVYLRQLGQEHADKNKVCTYSLVNLDEHYREDILKAGTTDAQMLLLKDKARVSAKRDAILNFISKSEWYKNYDSVEVPEDFIVECKEVEAEDEEKSKFTNLSAVDRREIEKRMVAYTLRWDHLKEYNLILEKIEPKAKDLMSSSTRIYYCTKEDEGKMRAAALLLKNVAPHFKEVYPEAGWSDNGNQREAPNYPIFWYEHPPVRFMKWDNKGQYHDWAVNPVQGWDTPQLIRVSQNKVKFITQNPNVKHIDELFLQLTDNNGYTMDNSLIKYYTAHKLEKINNFKFLQGLKCIHPTLQEDYCELMDLRNDNYSRYEYRKVAEIAPAIVEHMDKVFEFQKFMTQCDDEDLIAQKSKELFVLADISNAKAADLTILAKYDNILEFAEEVKPLLDELSCLESRDCDMSSALEKEVRVYLRAKSRETWES